MNTIRLIVAALTFSCASAWAQQSCEDKAQALERDFMVCLQYYGADSCFSMLFEQGLKIECEAVRTVCIDSCELARELALPRSVYCPDRCR